MKKNLNSKKHDTMANQCVACGNEMPEGGHVCKLCREQEEREMTPEERLLKAIVYIATNLISKTEE